jgi:hypothetical protein
MHERVVNETIAKNFHGVISKAFVRSFLVS